MGWKCQDSEIPVRCQPGRLPRRYSPTPGGLVHWHPGTRKAWAAGQTSDARGETVPIVAVAAHRQRDTGRPRAKRASNAFLLSPITKAALIYGACVVSEVAHAGRPITPAVDLDRHTNLIDQKFLGVQGFTPYSTRSRFSTPD